MICFAQMTENQSDPDGLVGLLAVLGLGCFAPWKFFCWLRKSSNIPDHWDDQVAADIAKDAATSL